MDMDLRGVHPAIITPFNKDKSVDEIRLRKNIEFLIENGVSGIVPCGTTGESATLSHDEHKKVIEISVDAASGKVPVIAGTGSNSTSEAVNLTKFAEDVGVDVAMLITPYYNKPTERGLLKHYKKISRCTDLPIIVYNVPSRTGTNMDANLISKISQISNIIGVKEASGDIGQVSRIIEKTSDKFSVISGDDSMTLPITALGGMGVISVVGNIVPSMMSDMVSLGLSGDIRKARGLHYKLSPLFRAMFLETNPIPVKAAAEMMGLCNGILRSPMNTISQENKNRLKEVMKGLNLI